MPIRKCRTSPDCLPRENVRQVCMAPTGWEETRFPICWFSVSVPENTPRSSLKKTHWARSILRNSHPRRRRALRPFERNGSENPYAVQHKLQDVMQDLVGIVRQEQEMLQALERIRELKIASDAVSVDGNREYNAGWHTALDLHNLLTVSEIVTRAALERKESRGAHFRDDFPAKDEQSRKIQYRGAERTEWRSAARRASQSRPCERTCSKSLRR